MTYYDSIADGYDELHKEEQLNKLRIIKENLGDVGSSLLDVGCGTGFSLDLFNVEKKIGLDPSKELLKYCKHQTICASAESIPFPDNSFDTVICVTAVHNFDDMAKGLSEIRRVAKRSVAISVLRKSEKFDDIQREVRRLFKVDKELNERFDRIFFCST